MELGGGIRSFTDFGKNGVQMFFIISGILAAKGFDGKTSNTSDVSKYYIKRIISIAPLYYFAILWYFVTENILEIAWKHIPVDIVGLGWLRYLFLLNGFIADDTYFWSNLGITWTIPVFAFFYLIAPFIMRFMKGYKSALFALALIFFTERVALCFYKCTIIENLHFFFIGILVFFCWKDNVLTPCAFCFTTIAIIFLILGRNCYPALFATIICCGLEREIKINEKIQNVVNYIDEHSYTLYLVHGIVFCSLIDRIRCDRFGIPNAIIGVIAVLGSFCGTVIVHRVIEKPIQGYLKRKLSMKM